MGATNANQLATDRRAAPGVSVFLMVNNFETGGSERQFTVIANSFDESAFDVHLGCVSRRGPLAGQVGGVREFPLGGSLFGLTSLRSRIELGCYLRSRAVQVVQSFDFYANLTLIPAARFAKIPVIIGSHRQLGDLLPPAKFRAQVAAFRWCDAVVCNSQAAAEA